MQDLGQPWQLAHHNDGFDRVGKRLARVLGQKIQGSTRRLRTNHLIRAFVLFSPRHGLSITDRDLCEAQLSPLCPKIISIVRHYRTVSRNRPDITQLAARIAPGLSVADRLTGVVTKITGAKALAGDRIDLDAFAIPTEAG